MGIKDVFLILLPIIAGLISSYFTYYFTIKSKKSEAILKFKVEKYTNLLVSLKGFLGKTPTIDMQKNF